MTIVRFFQVIFIQCPFHSTFLRKRIKGICEARGLSIEPVGSEISNKLAREERRHYFSGGSLVFVLCVGIDTKSHGLFLSTSSSFVPSFVRSSLGKLAPYFKGFNSERLSDQAFMAFHLRD